MNTRVVELIDKLAENQRLPEEELLELLEKIEQADQETEDYLYGKAETIRQKYYGRDIYVRGLIEFSNYCKNDCYYCGIRKSNHAAERYRLNKKQILDCCEKGYDLGFRTFVLQGGEDPYFTQERVCDIVATIKEKYPDCAVTLSIGEKSFETYKAFFEAGADRYLLRHETADEAHYGILHPQELTAQNRQKCLYDLKEIGYQIGCGIMVGSPGQTKEHIVKDLQFMEKLQPHMVGIGPFIPHKDTPFKEEKAGTLTETLHLLSIIRLMLPTCLLPATTALGTIHSQGRELGVKAGANVVMPNLSPSGVREKYLLYDGKICTGDEAAESKHRLEARMERIGYQLVVDRGDHISLFS